MQESPSSYEECKDCNSGIHLKNLEFDAETHLCAQCKCFVADREDFFKTPIELMSK